MANLNPVNRRRLSHFLLCLAYVAYLFVVYGLLDLFHITLGLIPTLIIFGIPVYFFRSRWHTINDNYYRDAGLLPDGSKPTPPSQWEKSHTHTVKSGFMDEDRKS